MVISSGFTDVTDVTKTAPMFRAPASDKSFVPASGQVKATEGASMQDQLVIMPATGANIKKARDRPRLRFWAASRRQKIETLDGELLWFRGQRRAHRSAATVAPAAVLDHGHDWIGYNDLMRR
jgi:hypothetical protein